MTDNVNNNGSAGSDGIVPIYQENARWCIWGMHEIWMGEAGRNKYVPKVNDYVIEAETFTVYIVESLDYVTLIPTLREIRALDSSTVLSETDRLLGVGPGQLTNTYRVYIDKSVTPHVLAVDIRFLIPGTMSSYAKLFRGSDLSSTGEVISRVYDGSYNIVSTSVPLEMVIVDNHINYSVKCMTVCHTTEDLLDGEIITAVVYSDDGHVVTKQQFLVENTTFIRSVNISTKYITGITATCAFMSPTDDRIINFPLNVPINALNLMGTVHYSDGSSITLPVNGTKFTMFGLDQYLASIVGQKVDLVLNYTLSSNEVSYSTGGSFNSSITAPYNLVTVNPNNSYAVKLFGYPVWQNTSEGYLMKWWLLNLDRNIIFDVTSLVSWSSNTGSFNPKLYGHIQAKTVFINLQDISFSFANFIHVQNVVINLIRRGSDNSIGSHAVTPWLVSTNGDMDEVNYNDGLFAISTSSSVNISSGITNFSDWINRVYLNTKPMVNLTNEVSPIMPTHFSIVYGNTIDAKFTINDWNSDLNIGTNISNLKTIFIKFIKETNNIQLILSMAAMIVYR